MNDTDNGKHELCRKVGRLGAIIMQQWQIIALLRAEVKAWRDCVSPSDAVTTRMQACVEEAIAATDAAGALEDK